MNIQLWVSAIGSLGSLAVAIAVFSSNRQQVAWQNRVANRNAQIEDQKLRLALLDRRIATIEKVRSAIRQFWTEGAVREDAAVSLGQALQVAELVYDQDEKAAIESFLQDAWKWQSLNRTADAVRPRAHGFAGDADKYDAALEKLFPLEEQMLAASTPLIERLIVAARVQQVAPLPEPPSNAMVRWWRSRRLSQPRNN